MQAGDDKREARVQVCAQVGYGQEKLTIAEDKAKHVKWIRSTQSCTTKMTELIIFQYVDGVRAEISAGRDYTACPKQQRKGFNVHRIWTSSLQNTKRHQKERMNQTVPGLFFFIFKSQNLTSAIDKHLLLLPPKSNKSQKNREPLTKNSILVDTLCGPMKCLLGSHDKLPGLRCVHGISPLQTISKLENVLHDRSTQPWGISVPLCLAQITSRQCSSAPRDLSNSPDRQLNNFVVSESQFGHRDQVYA